MTDFFYIASRFLITSRPYAIAGVAGFHRGSKPSVTGFSQPERRLKPAPHKNVGHSRIDHGSRRPRDTSRHLDDGTGGKSRARRTRAVAQASSSIRRDHLLLNQHRKCLIPFDVVLKVVSHVSTARSIALFMQTLSSEAPYRPKITS